MSVSKKILVVGWCVMTFAVGSVVGRELDASSRKAADELIDKCRTFVDRIERTDNKCSCKVFDDYYLRMNYWHETAKAACGTESNEYVLPCELHPGPNSRLPELRRELEDQFAAEMTMARERMFPDGGSAQ